jgi:hypothetical protein
MLFIVQYATGLRHPGFMPIEAKVAEEAVIKFPFANRIEKVYQAKECIVNTSRKNEAF